MVITGRLCHIMWSRKWHNLPPQTIMCPFHAIEWAVDLRSLMWRVESLLRDNYITVVTLFQIETLQNNSLACGDHFIFLVSFFASDNCSLLLCCRIYIYGVHSEAHLYSIYSTRKCSLNISSFIQLTIPQIVQKINLPLVSSLFWIVVIVASK
jgi:hypothetical protein